MAESTLTLGFTDIKMELGFFLGYGSDPDGWSAAQKTEIELIVNTGYRNALYPPAIQGIPIGYEWSFLRPTATLSVVADDYLYDFPDDYGRIIGEFNYAADEHKAPIRQIPLSQLLNMQSTSDMTGYANFFSTRWKESDQSGGQRQEVLFYPTFDAAYTLYYNYEAYTGVLSDTYPYPLGGMKMSELYKESCLSVAESRNEDTQGVHTQLFQMLLVDRVARDMSHGGQNYGQMGHKDGMDDIVEWRRGSEIYDSAYSITYDGGYI